jgi:hypothetical protein
MTRSQMSLQVSLLRFHASHGYVSEVSCFREVAEVSDNYKYEDWFMVLFVH